MRDFGVRSIYFIDLEFTASPEQVRGLCEYHPRPQHPRALVLPDADRQDRRAAPAADEAGRLPVDSFRRRVGQPADRRDDEEAGDDHPSGGRRELAQRIGLEVLCFFLLGYPGETEEEMRSTMRWPGGSGPRMLRFIASRPIRARRFTTSSPPAARSFSRIRRQRRKIAAGWDRLIREALWSYYIRPGYIVSRLIGTSPASWWRQLRLFAGYFH